MSSNKRRTGNPQQSVTAGALDDDARAEVLARVYALILSWPTSDEKQEKQHDGDSDN